MYHFLILDPPLTKKLCMAALITALTGVKSNNSIDSALPEDTLFRVTVDHLVVDQLAQAGAVYSSSPTHSRHTARAAAMITGPRKRPTNPNDCSPPRIPIRASRKGSRAEPPMSAG